MQCIACYAPMALRTHFFISVNEHRPVEHLERRLEAEHGLGVHGAVFGWAAQPAAPLLPAPWQLALAPRKLLQVESAHITKRVLTAYLAQCREHMHAIKKPLVRATPSQGRCPDIKVLRVPHR